MSLPINSPVEVYPARLPSTYTINAVLSLDNSHSVDIVTLCSLQCINYPFALIIHAQIGIILNPIAYRVDGIMYPTSKCVFMSCFHKYYYRQGYFKLKMWVSNFVQVLEERIQHIEYMPPVPEEYYQPNGREIQPKPVGEEAGVIVFQYYPMSAVNYVSMTCAVLFYRCIYSRYECY